MPKGNGKPIPKVVFSKTLAQQDADTLVSILQTRFASNSSRHSALAWDDVYKRLSHNPAKLLALHAMEQTGGEPDVIGYDVRTGEYLFVDCSAQTPLRRSICYDLAGEQLRHKKGIFPGGNAVSLAAEMGIDILDKDQYKHLQQLGEFDTKTSSWLKTPEIIRDLGGALFGDRRYNTVFVFHNGAESFYSDRGFRGLLRV